MLVSTSILKDEDPYGGHNMVSDVTGQGRKTSTPVTETGTRGGRPPPETRDVLYIRVVLVTSD